MRQALIVDDSKTASVSLCKLLEKQGIDAAVVSSGEDALVYLQSAHPDIIFMDHLMPGMDGFESVKAIKSDPQKAHIPVVMYTSKRGDMYVGQARALGAADILPKPASESDLGDVLERMRRASEQVSRQSPRIEVAAVLDEPQDEELPSDPPPEVAVVRRSIREVKQSVEAAKVLYADEQQADEAVSRSLLRQLLPLLVMVLPVLWLLALYIPAEQQRQQLLAAQQGWYNTIAWSLNQSAAYDYGELPMSAERLYLLEGLVAHLAAQGYRGKIRLEGHVGDFCLVGESGGGGRATAVLPRVDMPLTDCAQIGWSTAQALEISGRQSAAFKAFLNNSPLLASGDISVEVLQLGASRPRVEYPVEIDGVSAGDWNNIALRNTRVEFVLIPRAAE